MPNNQKYYQVPPAFATVQTDLNNIQDKKEFLITFMDMFFRAASTVTTHEGHLEDMVECASKTFYILEDHFVERLV